MSFTRYNPRMSSREELVLQLVSTGRLKVDQRALLGDAPLMEAELRSAIATALPRSRFFPPAVEQDRSHFEGSYLESMPDGKIRFWTQSLKGSSTVLADRTICVDYTDREKAIEMFIRKVWPTRQIDGIPFFRDSQRMRL